MFRFLSKHITNSTEQKTEDLTDFFSYSKVSLHGFPQKVSCICLDQKLGLLAIGTKEGILRIVGAEGIEWTTTIDFGLHVEHIYFAEGSGVLMALCDDVRMGNQSFYRSQIVNDKIVLKRFNHTNLKGITCCEMLNREDGNSALLIGTIIGNIYALWVQNLELVEYLVFLDTALKNIKVLEGGQRQINRIEFYPEDCGKIFMMFNNKLIVLYDTFQDSIKRIFLSCTGLTNICVFGSSNKLFCSTVDGSYTVFHLEDDTLKEGTSKTPFRPFECNPIVKILCAKLVKNHQDIIIFSGGMPCASSYGDRYTLSLMSEKEEIVVVLDFESPVLDFVVLCDCGDEQIASALFVLCEQELVVVDLKDQSWPMFALPYFNCIHSSPITTTAIFSNISKAAYTRLCELHQQQSKRSSLSKRKWPLKCGHTFSQAAKNDEIAWKEATLLFTGHENGCVCIWLTNSLSLSPWITLNSANDFEGFAMQDSQVQTGPTFGIDGDKEGEWPPIKKAGVFDSCADDHRLSIVKIVFDTETADIVVGGRAGQILVYEPILSSGAAGAPRQILIDMTQGATDPQPPNSRGIRSKNALPPRTMGESNGAAATAFSLAFNIILQFQPVVPVSALAWLANRSLLAVGNEFGYSVCNLETKEIILKHSLISLSEIVQISNLDGTLSRFKSVKKTIRQSFRRKKRQNESEDLPANSIQRQQPKLAKQNGSSIVEEFRPAEREIAQRAINPNVLIGETPNSLVKVLQVFQCSLSSAGSAPREHLFVGTHGGFVLIHSLLESAENAEDKCPLVKEIRLQHHAPIIGMECVQDLLAWKLFVFTEEQIRLFLLPGLKPLRYKCRFTAVEGARIRRASTVLLKNSKSKRLKTLDRFISLITNRGEVYLLSTINSKRQIHVPFTRITDAAGISSAVISTNGELFFLRPGGSELQRACISACPTYSAPCPFQDEQFPLLNNPLI